MEKSLKTRQICLFFLAFLPAVKLFMMPSIVATICGEDLWISVAVNLCLDLLTLVSILTCFSGENQSFFSFLEKTFGKTGKKIILCLYFLYFLFKSVLPIHEQKDYVELTLYITSPNSYVFLPFFALVIYLCSRKLRVLGRISDVMFFTTLIGSLMIIALSFKGIDFGTLLPVGANGLNKILKGSVSSLGWFGDAVYMLFFVGEYQKEKHGNIKIILSFLLAGLFVVLFTVIFYSAFTSIAFRQRFALTELSKYTTVINEVGRFDYVAIFFILFSSVFSLSLPLYFAVRCISEAFPLKKTWIYPTIISTILIIILTLFRKYFASLEEFSTGVGGYIFLIFGVVLPIVFCLINLGVRKNEKY